MPVRIKITLLFTMIMFLLLLLLCGFIYYFAYAGRLANIKAHLTNQALTTAKLLSEPKTFDEKLMNKIDSATIISMKDKTIQAYNYSNEKIYSYSDSPGDSLQLSINMINEARAKNSVFFTTGKKEAIAFCANKNREGIVILAAAFDEEGERNLRHLKFILWLSFMGGTVIALISGYFFSKILLRPVKKIADEVNIISAQSLAHRIKLGKSDDEWSYLAKTLNDLLDRLQESFEIQRRFISSASHELSTPLTSISSQLEVSLQRNRTVEEYRLVMQSVYQDVRELSKLTQTLLEFATASGTAGGLELNLIRIDEVLMRLPAEMMKQEKTYSVKLEFDQLPEDEEKLFVFGNAELLFTAIKNVVSNACKYSDNRLARVGLTVKEKEITVSVEDNGKGIPENELKNIFHPFYRSENNRAIKGFGVGLPLVQRIIKIHKGEIKVCSALEKGTIVAISLPIAEINR